jgi:flagellar hook-associated protein 3 FlgL
MRVADNSLYSQVNDNLANNRAEMADLQNKSATQKRVTKPSDDPVAASRVLAAKTDVTGLKQYAKDLNYAQSFLNFTDQSLDEMTQVIARVKELSLGQASDAGANAVTRKVVGTEVEQLISQVIKIGNRKLGDRYIFGGYKTTEAPFDQNGSYSGDDGEIMINVDKGSFVSMNVPGSRVFLGKGLSKDGISHSNGKQPETIAELRASIAQQEQIKNKESNQNQIEPLSIDPNTNVSLRGPASVNANQNNSKVGVENNVESGNRNVFTVLKRLEVALKTNDKYSVQDSLEDIDKALSQVVLTRSQIGSRSMSLSGAYETLQKGKVDAEGMVSQLQDVDLYKVVSDINKTESTLQATLATSGKLIQPSLMDFLN